MYKILSLDEYKVCITVNISVHTGKPSILTNNMSKLIVVVLEFYMNITVYTSENIVTITQLDIFSIQYKLACFHLLKNQQISPTSL